MNSNFKLNSGFIKSFYRIIKNHMFSGVYEDLKDKPDSMKNPKSLKFTGASTESYDGSVEKTINIPTQPSIPSALKNPESLTFTGGVTGSYDGSVPKSVPIPTTLPANGGNADTVDGFHASQDSVANTAVVRNANGGIKVGAIISDTEGDEPTTISEIIVTEGDNQYKKISYEKFRDNIGRLLGCYYVRNNIFFSFLAIGGISTYTVKYVNFAVLVTARYSPQPIMFTLTNRATGYMKVIINLSDTSSYDAPISSFKCAKYGSTKGSVYAVKTSAQRWDLYMSTGNYDSVSCVGYTNQLEARLEKADVGVTSLPAGYIEATVVDSL